MDDPRRAAAHRAVDEHVRSGMVVGLGTGATASWAVRRIGELLASGVLRDVKGIPTSDRTAALAGEVGVPLTSLAESRPDVTIDGADEIDPNLALIKGRGGALLREKITAAAGDGFVVVADDSKLVDALGRDYLPVEVEPFGFEATLRALAALGCEAHLRRTEAGESFLTDGGHYTADCTFEAIPDPQGLERRIRDIPGALECGLFVGLAGWAYVAGDGGVRVIRV